VADTCVVMQASNSERQAVGKSGRQRGAGGSVAERRTANASRDPCLVQLLLDPCLVQLTITRRTANLRKDPGCEAAAFPVKEEQVLIHLSEILANQCPCIFTIQVKSLHRRLLRMRTGSLLSTWSMPASAAAFSCSSQGSAATPACAQTHGHTDARTHGRTHARRNTHTHGMSEEAHSLPDSCLT